MRFNQVDMNLLHVFDAIYAERNLTRAAEILHITQPAVSNALRRLRTTFNDPLFVRSAQEMVPTPLARNTIGRVRRALTLVASCVEPQIEFDPNVNEQTLHLSFSDLAEELLLPPLVTQLTDFAPKMALRSYQVPRATLPTELAAGTLDLAVDVAFVNDVQLYHAPLFFDEFVCAVRDEHPLIRRKPTLKQYLALGHVHISSRRKGVGEVDQLLKTLGQRRRIVTRLRGYATAPHILRSTDLACTMPRSIAEQAGLKCFALPFDTPPVAVHMYWHKSADEDPANRWLRQLLEHTAAQLNLTVPKRP